LTTIKYLKLNYRLAKQVLPRLQEKVLKKQLQHTKKVEKERDFVRNDLLIAGEE